MKRIALFATSFLGFLAAAVPAFAQGAAASNQYDQGALALLAAGLAIGISAGLCGIGQGKAAASACEATARNPGAGGRVFTLAVMGLAFIESLTIYALVIAFIIMGKAPAVS